MKVILIVTLLFLFTVFYSHSQSSDLNFLVQKIKVDYPGYKEKTKAIDFDRFVNQIITENKTDTFKAMGLIVDFFQDRHLDIISIKHPLQIDSTKYLSQLIRIKKYLKTTKSAREGYWLNDYNNCVMALVKNGSKGFQGYIIESKDSSLLFPGAVGYELDSIGKNTFFTKFTSDYSGAKVYLRSTFKSDSILITGPGAKWRKINKYSGSILGGLPAVSEEASCQLLDNNNFLITIPTCSRTNANIVDSLVKLNLKLISKTKNLIIDLRQNTGGTVRAYRPLLPFVYTTPIIKISGELYCSKDNIDETKKDISDYIHSGNIDSSYLKNWLALVKMEEDSIGKFISGPVDTLYYDSVMAYPKNVGIITNYANQSAAEMMLLDCKQSKKVKLFGEHTMGAVDYLDYYSISFPSEKYKLMMPTTRRFIPLGGSKLDYKGIYPDVEIPESESNWVDFVKRYYEEH